MADNPKGSPEAGNQPSKPAVARLLEAEAEADKIVRRAQQEAEEIVAAARRRAKQIQDAASSPETEAAHVSQARAELEKQEHLILGEASRRIEAMGAAAAARVAQAVEKLVALLFAES